MKIYVSQHSLKIEKQIINEKEINITKCEFEFDEAITNNYVKDVYFTLNDNTYKIANIQNNECDIPNEVLNKKGMVELGVVAYLIENNEYVKRYNPTPTYFPSELGSLKDEYENSESVTPTDKEQMEQSLQEMEIKVDNIDIDAEKVGTTTTITITKKDGTQEEVEILDGVKGDKGEKGDKGDQGIQGIQGEQGVQGIQGVKGDTGEPFTIKKTYSSVAEMNADFNNMEFGDYVMIASSVEIEDNAKLYTKGENSWIFISDFSGAQGIKGEKGDKGDQGIQGIQGVQGIQGETGATGNGIASVTKIGTSGLVDTYTITFTNGNTTTFDVTNGKGISRIEKTATIDNVDTYTIYFNDNTTTTFEVANGEVTKEELEEEVDRLSMIYNLFPTTSDEDTEMTLNGTGEVTFKKFDLKANTLQDGTPTPDSPVPVQVVSGNNNIKVEGKNLVNFANLQTSNNTTYTWQNDILEVKATTGTYNRAYIDITSLYKSNPGKALRFDYDSIDFSQGINPSVHLQIFQNGTNNYVVLVDTDGSITTRTIPYDTSEITQVVLRIVSNNTNTSQASQISITKPILHFGETVTTYTPYTSQTYPINLGNIELCKIEDYKDRIYKSNDKWYIEKNIGKVVLTGATSENWAQNSSQTQTNTNYFSSNVIDNLLKSGEKNGVSNYFTVVNELWNIDIQGIQFSTSSSNIRLRINKTIASDLATFKTWLSNNNAIVYYVLETPTTTEITDITLIEQLENLQKAYSYDTQTNISQTNTDISFILDVEALMSLKNVLNT